MATVDNHELAQLAADLKLAPGRAKREGARIMKRGALEVKRAMGKDFESHDYSGRLGRALEFEKDDGDGLAYRIGELDSAGPSWGIAAIMAFGTSNNAPVVDITQPARKEAFAIERHLGAAGEQAVLGGSGTARV
jgi:hypothetical protein